MSFEEVFLALNGIWLSGAQPPEKMKGEDIMEVIQVWMRRRLKRLVTRYQTYTVVSVVASCTLTIIYKFCDGYRFHSGDAWDSMP